MMCCAASTTLCSDLRLWAEQFPYQNRDAAHQQALDSAPVEVCEDAGVHTKLPQSPQEIEPLTSFLDHGACV